MAFARTSELRDSVLRPDVARPVDWPGLDGPAAATFAVFAPPTAAPNGLALAPSEPIVTVSVVPAACRWRPEAARPWQLRAMATAIGWRGRGVGAPAVAAVVDHIRAEGGDLLWCNARLGARTFYERAGFAIEGDQFDVTGIGPHLPMARLVTPVGQ